MFYLWLQVSVRCSFWSVPASHCHRGWKLSSYWPIYEASDHMSGYKGVIRVTTRDLQNVAPKVDKQILKLGWKTSHCCGVMTWLRPQTNKMKVNYQWILQGWHFCGFWSKIFKAEWSDTHSSSLNSSITLFIYLFAYVQIGSSHYIAMFIALLWLCTRLLSASLSTHQSCVKDTSASIPNICIFLFSFLHMKRMSYTVCSSVIKSLSKL